jgi:chromosome segregation ATPase
MVYDAITSASAQFLFLAGWRDQEEFMRCSSVVLAGFIIVIAGLAVSTSASQSTARQAGSQQEDILPALLVEVRGLRAAMEQMASAGPRVQLALGRVQLQEQRVNNLMRRIEDARGQLADAQRKHDQMQQQLRGVQEAIREPNPNGPPVAELQGMQRETEREIARVAAEVQRLTAESATMDADLATEQGRWIDLNQRMEALEQSLIRR